MKFYLVKIFLVALQPKEVYINNRFHIAEVIETTRRVAPGHFENCVAQRAQLDPMAAGSLIEGVNSIQLEQILLNAEWEEYSHDALMPGCRAFKANIPGRLGVINLSQLPDNKIVTLDDRKNTGSVYCVVKGVLGPEVDFTVVILGLEQGEEVVFTFHPGDPVAPSEVSVEPGLIGQQVTVEEALKMGLKTAKIV